MNNILNEEEIQKSIKKIKMYKEQEDLFFDELKTNLKSINYNYNSTNKDNLDLKEKEVIKKSRVITKNHNNNILVLQKNLIKYKNISKKVANIFDNI